MKNEQSKQEGQQSIQENKNFDVSELKFFFLILAPISLVFGLFVVKFLGISFDNLGTYGDFIGGGTIPFLTIASILFILETIKLQKQQLIVQEKEMSDTRKTLEEQSKTARMQRFENTFFILLNQIKEDLHQLPISESAIFQSHHDYFKSVRKQFQTNVNMLIKDYEERLSNENHREEYFEAYADWLNDGYLDLPSVNHQEYHNFSFHTGQLFQLILRYKSEMDEWEIGFYLDLTINEIGSDGFYMLVYAASLRLGINWNMVKELNLLEYISPVLLNSRRDYDYFEYINETDFDISDSISKRLREIK